MERGLRNRCSEFGRVAHERLTKTADFVNYPALSPDGSQVAFVAFVSRNQGLDSNPDSSHYAVRPLFQQRYRIVVAPADATLLDLTKDRAQINRPGYTNRAALFPPVWAPSGKQLAYVLYEGESIPYNEVIFTARLDGTGGSRIGDTQQPCQHGLPMVRSWRSPL